MATTRYGEEINIGDDVEIINYHKACQGQIFTVFKIIEEEACESGHIICVHLKGFPERILKPKFTEGLDTNWFKKAQS